MNIEFNIFKLKPNSNTYKRWSNLTHMTKYLNSEFIVVGEEQISDKA